ncbi:PTS sugar transporter subunit IIA [Paramicrobacterium agarici]|uniref:PTS system mannose-specific IIA component/PTS system mannose-specific IIB component n=1 Tax=Paramicrobacterium agarici TaxID=630514 RepID=A0A2A9DWF2_9MICO|nr:PTS sugar transporter subunit IIA [Microbacterium agarici]PFG30696.1 PTS system mannose-specific IIA component/PTS system mannose-specific IIB component [Microbacterium agarici]
MRPIIVVAHGHLASALLATAEMIVGPAPSARAVDFEVGSSIEDLQNRVAAAVEEFSGAGRALLFVDLAGGSPSRIAAKLALDGDSDVVAGANLPMLIHALTAGEGEDSVEDVLAAGTDGVCQYGVSKRVAGGLQ